MSYSHQQIDDVIGNALDTSGANAVTKVIGSQPIMVRGLFATVTTAVTTATATLTFQYRPTPGSSSGETTLGTLAVTVGAVGRQFYKDITPVRCMPGGEIRVVSDGGGDAGVAGVGIRHTPSWEHPSNNTQQIESA